MLTWIKSFVARIRWSARRWLPGFFVRVTREDVTDAHSMLAGLTEEEIEEGRDAVTRAIRAAREREGAPPPEQDPS